MKGFFTFYCQWIQRKHLFLVIMCFAVSLVLQAQNNQNLYGRAIDQKSGQTIPFASIGLFTWGDSVIIGSSLSDDSGLFRFNSVTRGKYILKIQHVGYQLFTGTIDLEAMKESDTLELFLSDKTVSIKETVIAANAIKARTGQGKTDYFVTKKMLDHSVTGIDIMKLIPGIQVDLRQNISLEGSSNIVILVDGKERDMHYINQISPDRIEKVEVLSTPPSNMDGHITGAINVVLKKERKSGFSGQIIPEIPVSDNFIYLFPTYNLNYSKGRVNLFTSYSGEINGENINESSKRQIWENADTVSIFSNQYVRQKYWFHRFNYGFDYYIGKKDMLNFYGFYNPYSHEQDGLVVTRRIGETTNKWTADKDETDKNTGLFYSLFYKHAFDQKGREFSIDLSHFNLNGQNTEVFYRTESPDNSILQKNTVQPHLQVSSMKTDFTTRIDSSFNLSAGVKIKQQVMQNKTLSDFSHYENTLGIYARLSYKKKSIEASSGIRVEKSDLELKNSFAETFLYWLPSLTFRYKCATSQNLMLAYNRNVNHPHIYQLNPAITWSDPYTVNRGNPELDPEIRDNLFLEHTVQFKGNFVSSRIFYNKTTAVISNMVFINDTGSFEIQRQNLGAIHQFGIQASGSLKFGIITLNPYIRVYRLNTRVNSLARSHHIENRKTPGFESGLSALMSFRKEFSLSMLFQYATPKNNIQDNHYSDPLYMLSFEKAFKHGIKAGIVSAIPFKKSMIYQGSDIDSRNFYTHYKGILEVPALPIWFKLSYQFNTGVKRDNISRSHEELDNVPKKDR